MSKSDQRILRRNQLSNMPLNNQSHKLLGAPPPKCEVFVSRVKEGTEECISQYLIERRISVLKIDKVSHSESKFKSFKITIYKYDLNTLLDRSFWPLGFKASLWKRLNNYEPRLTKTIMNSNRQFNNARFNSNLV